MNENKYKYCSASQNQKWLNTNIIWLLKNDQILYTNTNFVELPKRRASKTSSEAHKVILNSPSPLMTEAITTNVNSFQSIWLTQCDSGIWGWIAVVAHRVVLQRRVLKEEVHICQGISWGLWIGLMGPLMIFKAHMSVYKWSKFILQTNGRHGRKKKRSSQTESLMLFVACMYTRERGVPFTISQICSSSVKLILAAEVGVSFPSSKS